MVPKNGGPGNHPKVGGIQWRNQDMGCTHKGLSDIPTLMVDHDLPDSNGYQHLMGEYVECIVRRLKKIHHELRRSNGECHSILLK